jgi:hypothetical protein
MMAVIVALSVRSSFRLCTDVVEVDRIDVNIVFFHTLHACMKDLVTEVDEASEKLILNGLKESFPHHEFVGEVSEHAQWLQAEVQCPQALRHKHRMTLCTHICVCVYISSHGVYAASRDAS